MDEHKSDLTGVSGPWNVIILLVPVCGNASIVSLNVKIGVVSPGSETFC